MDLKAKLGQMLVFGFPGKELDEDSLRLIREYKAGNIILFSHNIENAGQMADLCSRLRNIIEKETGQPPFITIDQEGGVVSRVPEGVVCFPSAMAVAATQNPENARLAALYTASELGALGVNMNMAPVLDINTNPDNPVIGVRSYGDKPETVGSYGLAAIDGSMAGGIMPVIKHFPGHGDTATDSHLGLPKVEKSLDELLRCELVPFARAIKAGAPCVMTSHILFPQIEKNELPATMSPLILNDILRGRLGFDGLISSDCLEMDAIAKFYGTPQGFLAAVGAGVDLPCISHSPRLAIEAMELCLAAAQKDESICASIDKAANRIIEYKKTWAKPPRDKGHIGLPLHMEAAKKMYDDCICRVGGRADCYPVDENTLFAGSYAYRSTFASNPVENGENFPGFLAGRFGAKQLITPVNPTDDEIKTLAENAAFGQTVVYGTYNGHINKGQIKLANAFAGKGCRLVAVALRNPYDLPLIDNSAYKLAAFQYDAATFASVEAVLSGKSPAGKLSVSL